MISARNIALSIVVVLATLLLALACSRPGSGGTRYHCPMHPTYVSDQPGDCPICGMRLVPIEEHARVVPSPAPAGSMTAPAGSGKTIWTCPMDPDVVSDHPGRCPKCGMALESRRAPEPPAAASGVAGLAPIDIDPEGMRLAGVRTAVAEHKKLERTIRAVGIVRPDETRVRHVHTKISGWVDKLVVNFTGEAVKKGNPILSLYSQELLATQEEYLRAREAAQSLEKSGLASGKQQADLMLSAARRRLELFDVPTSLINDLDKHGQPHRSVMLLAPSSGIVTGKQIFEGQQVEPGMELFTISDLSRVWIEADVYENEANAVHVGSQAQIALAYAQQAAMPGSVKYIYPYLNPETRTLRIRFEFPNPELALKLDAYVNVEIPVASDEE